MKIVFILAIITLLVFAAASILKERKYTKIIRYISCGATVVLSVITAIAADYLRSLAIGMAIFTAGSCLLALFADRLKKDSAKAFVRYMAKAMLVVLLLEAICFNFNSYHLWKGGYEEASLDLNSAVVTGMTKSGDNLISTGEGASIEIPALDQKIGVIKLDLKGTAYKTDYSIDFADETNAS